ncbi:DUF805 domain-containing protein [Photobacterium sp. DNB23_23_1]|uniref:DUF805 domain-containing protein n=1 Tax=Photobacterium pectinilyticum TaxID=2906793 RepID=A0ABT1N211_9GAMM|nr:DUF805 domain-containing protein [Photobacterium sp. ZSDE20]MCQ1057791.1 DUF805 domain-containing protein [Photobacterium sp. ZSDE20]MDD1822297.1 DUF805 domain-containing protein [Photobacterium sp. ZSDE20]
MNWYIHVLKKYAVFKGRARRQEYWYFFLFNIIISIALSMIDSALGNPGAGEGAGIIGTIYSLAILIPSIAVGVRRLHDTGRTGWWMLIGLIPLIGVLVLLYFFVLDSQPAVNEYGPNPKDPSSINLSM